MATEPSTPARVDSPLLHSALSSPPRPSSAAPGNLAQLRSSHRHLHSASSPSLPAQIHVRHASNPIITAGSSDPAGLRASTGSNTTVLGETTMLSPTDATSIQRPPSPAARLVERPEPDRLLKLGPAVVKGRSGAVLSRGFLLKTDHYASGRAKDLPHHLQGAPNFRLTDLGIFGTAQPTVSGLKTVLTSLKAHPGGRGKSVWFFYIAERPFVLRDAARPTQVYAMSDRAENIEGVEQRLKMDILREAVKYGGLIMVHEELVEGEILPTWIAASDVKTVRETWETVRDQGFHVDYHRIPIASDQAPEDSYLDRYVAIIRHIPTSYSLVFNCGMGVVRTTFAMCAAVIMRRRQVMKEGGDDVFGLEGKAGGVEGKGKEKEDGATKNGREVVRRWTSDDGAKVERAMKIMGEQQRRTRGLLRLMQLLQRCLPANNQQGVIELLTTRPELLENLQKGIQGDYDIVLSLVSILDQGILEKDLVDMVVNSCDDVINLRDDILEHRVRFAVIAMDEHQKNRHLRSALAGLERYFFLLAFASYCNEPPMSFRDTFSPWLKTRSEISNMIDRLRKSARQFIFAPVHDLSSLSRGDAGPITSAPALRHKMNSVRSSGNVIVAHEWAQHVVHNRRGITLRAGLILKSDQWATEFKQTDHGLRGAINFRRVPDTSLFALSQPTEEGIDRAVENARKDAKSGDKVTWINLREEPLIYINGSPYVLRLEAVSLRNIKSYAGISASRLELLEDRLKTDVLAELRAFDGRILLHTEAEDGSIIPVWETARPADVKTLREIMDQKSKVASSFTLDFKRQPITAEKAPDFEDVKHLLETVSSVDTDAPFIVNCQLGRGRSTLVLVCILLIQHWLRRGGNRFAFADVQATRRNHSYQMINNLLRVMRNGRGIKAAVDNAVERCSAVYDLIESIEACRRAAEEAARDSASKEERVKRGLQNLRRYSFVCIFTCYLNETMAETWRELSDSQSFEHFWREHQVFRTIQDELIGADIQALTPLEMTGNTTHGSAWTDEEHAVVAKRSGIILSAQTILKSDFFLGLQKMTLPLKITGLPNIRQVPLLFDHDSEACEQSIFGCGMPTVEGLRRGLERMRQGSDQKKLIFWTSMREEPVLYVKGRPHVLRLLDQPLENVITTGVATAAVEGMEDALKSDVIREVRDNNGRMLLHDEVEENGRFKVSAIWEDISEDDIMTPREVFGLMTEEGYPVNYARLPVTDEQAPLPGVFARLDERVQEALATDFAHLVFNCQMGRGRTTTGMVAAILVANIAARKDAEDPSGSIISDAQGMSAFSSVQGEMLDSWDGRDVDPYVQGDYKVILHLVSVLQYGRLAKKLTDKAIDAMDAVQNLRRAIYDFKCRADSAEHGSEKQKKILHAATNYLFRYGSLIAFANWLLERAEAEEDGLAAPPPFPRWLSERTEITHILQRRSLE